MDCDTYGALYNFVLYMKNFQNAFFLCFNCNNNSHIHDIPSQKTIAAIDEWKKVDFADGSLVEDVEEVQLVFTYASSSISNVPIIRSLLVTACIPESGKTMQRAHIAHKPPEWCLVYILWLSYVISPTPTPAPPTFSNAK